jgi:hypothetical protein
MTEVGDEPLGGQICKFSRDPRCGSCASTTTNRTEALMAGL